MTWVRQIISAVMAVSLVGAGVAAAQPAHAHSLAGQHTGSLHAVASDAEGDHYIIEGTHDNAHDAAPSHDHDQNQPEHENGIFHVHAVCFVALAPETVALPHASIQQPVEPAELVVTLHTRSIMPADRPPRTVL